MTREEACNAWLDAAENHTWGYDDLWNAACDWQKGQDIKFCEEWGCIVNYKDSSDD